MGAASIALVFQIVGVATASWVTADSDVIDARSGLWKTCSGIFGCLSYGSDVPDWMNACRAFGILGILLLVVCCLMGVLSCFSDNDKLPLMAAVVSFAAGLCVLIEFALYADKVDIGAGFKYGYSFALTVTACILAVVAGICFILSRRRGYSGLG
ncbi:hypothetical protein V1264_009324 [Littorina saxatilis]